MNIIPERLLQEFEKIIRSSRLVGVATHSNADPDALASLFLALRVVSHLGTRACFIIPEGLSKTSKKVLSELSLKLEDECKETGSLDVCITVDVSNPAQLGDKAPLCLSAEKLVVIDHHSEGELVKNAHIAMVYGDIPSTTEILVEACLRLGVPLDKELAELALAGILYDSRRFAIATKHSFLTVATLLDIGCDYKRVVELLTPEKSWTEELSERIAVLKALSRLEIRKACVDLIIASTYIGSHESLVAKKLLELGTDVALIVVERDEVKRVSVRVSKRALSKGISAPSLASFIASKFGGEGGGHESVAMAHIKSSKNAEEIVRELIESLSGKIGRVCEGTRFVREKAESLR
ncbi:MAG: DHH family phosphoesterase [Acidilobaceae archaeon]